MGDHFKTPRPADMYDPESWGAFFGPQLKNSYGALRTSDGFANRAQYVATTASVSDIMQGTFNYRNPNEILSVGNVALTQQLKKLDTPGLTSLGYLGPEPPDTVLNEGAAPAGTALPSAPAPAAGGVPGGGTNANVPQAGLNSVDQIVKAAHKVSDHPNWQMGKVGFMINGFPMTKAPSAEHDSYSNVAVFNGSTGYIEANLLNGFWIAMENGFIMADSGGFYNYRLTSGGSRSRHSFGRAWDLMSIGKAGVLGVTKCINSSSHGVIRQFTDLVLTWPKDRQPSEMGQPVRDDGYFYTGGHHNHIHFEFSKGGSLLPPLL